MIKFCSFGRLNSHLVKKLLNVRPITILRNKKIESEVLSSAISVDFENPNSPVPFCEVNRTNLKDYKFPILKIGYDQNDVVQHAESVGVAYGQKYSDFYLDKWNSKLRVLPSFVFPFTNKILLDMSLTNHTGWLKFDQTVHGEHFIEQIRPLPPKGEIDFEIKTLDVLDKGSGTLYCFSMNGYDTRSGECYFETEYQMFEIGTGNFGGKTFNPHLTRIAKPKKESEPDATLEFTAIVPEGGYKKQLSDFDRTGISIYSPLHPRQHYSDQYEFLPHPLAHGRYTFSRAINMILFKYDDGNIEKFKSAKVRFAEPVFLGENVCLSTWKSDSQIMFEGNVHRNGKTLKVLSGGYVDLNV